MILVGAVAIAGCGRGPFWSFPEAEVRRCSAVDFLFVIDSSESMEEHQDNLRGSFGPFIDGIESALDDVDDFHVGVVTTDAYQGNPRDCRELGALVTSTRGEGVQRTDCGPYAEGHRYMTEQDDLDEAFNCAANVGTRGSREEEPMAALRRAITPDAGWWRTCNDGFVRDDALLVNVIITDEADGERIPGEWRDPGTPEDWFRTVERVKGTERNAVVVSLLNGVTPGCPVVDPAFDGNNIAEFTRMFTHGFVEGICEPDYGEIFERAVDRVDEACTEYVAELRPIPGL
ncbi:MAG: hypothetical protein AB1Z98_29800 [Nannocystaceae bacterium]